MKQLWMMLLLAPTLASASLVSGKKELESQVAETADDSEELVYVTEDVPLDPEVEAFLNTPVEEIWEDNAYVYLWGIGYESTNVYQTGIEVAKLVQQADKDFDYLNPYDETVLDQFNELKRPDEDSLCHLRELGCAQKLYELTVKHEAFTAPYQHMIQRYGQFFEFEHFSVVSGTTVESLFPDFRFLLQAQYLNFIELNQKLLDGEHDQVIADIQKEAKQVRRYFKQANTPVSKLVMAGMFHNHLNWINWAHQQQKIQTRDLLKLEVLTPLSVKERSMYTAMQNAELMLLTMMLETTHIQIKYLEDNPPDHWAMKFFPNLAQAMIKPNLSVNVQYQRQVKPGLTYLQQDIRSFYDGLDELDISVEHDLQVNAYGRFFNYSDADSKKRIFDWQSRLFDLDMKIQLLKGLITFGSAEQFLEQLSVQPAGYMNSFDLSLPYIKEERICYSGLYEDNSDFRCLEMYPLTK